nr:aminoglycoside phosphotransferase family protein [Yoonia tamlensis]
MTPAAAIMARFGLRDAALVDHGKIATVWKVMRGKQPAALKIYHGGNTQDEWPGVRYIQSCAGTGAVQIFDYAEGALVMEWLGGPSLGDLARQGGDASASAQLGATALQLHKAAPPAICPACRPVCRRYSPTRRRQAGPNPPETASAPPKT